MTARDDLRVRQGADYSRDFPALDEHGDLRVLTGWVARAVIRHTPDSAVVHEPDVVVRPGLVRLTIPGAVSDGWGWRRSRYEIALVGPRGQRERFAEGRVQVDPSLVR